MTYQFAFGDESGVPSGKTEKSVSTHFVAALLLVEDADLLRKQVAKFRQAKRIPENADLKFNSTPAHNCLDFLHDTLPSNAAVWAVVIDKRVVQIEKKLWGLELYLYAWRKLLAWTATHHFQQTHILLDKYGNPEKTITDLQHRLRSHISAGVIAQLRADTGLKDDFGISAADMVVGAVFQMVEHGDSAFYRLLRPSAQIWRPLENENPPS